MSGPNDSSRKTADPLAELLRWYAEMGADEAVGEEPFAPSAPVAAPGRAGTDDTRTGDAQTGYTRPPSRTPPPAAPGRAGGPETAEQAGARAIADACANLRELEEAVRNFTGCPLRATATNTVFADGNPDGPVMLIGEAPGAEEDRIGKPFVGRSGQLLDRMLAAIGLDRQTNTLITNAVYWRPPGNRKPAPAEIAACLPFVRRHIALVDPAVLILCGGTAASALLGLHEGITKLRGRWYELPIPEIGRPIPSICLYHPSYLLRSPERKKEAWKDLLAIQSKLEELNKNSPRT